VVDGVQTGDELTGVDGLSTDGATLDAVIRSLHGQLGDKKTLHLVRNGEKFEQVVVVQGLL
jgi:C-terminal processing protease CtpA/Prc